MSTQATIKVGLAQLAPVWLDKQGSLNKVLNALDEASQNECDLLVFGETFLPGYPFWIGLTDGAQFDAKIQKELHAHYLHNAICIQEGDLDPVRDKARETNTALYLGIAERALDRGGHCIYCSLVYIDPSGTIGSVHRKLQPTYEERLTWSPGDGHGLEVHDLSGFRTGGLNCWENWMPLPRTALYAQGENLHIAAWPGSDYNTKDITRFMAREGRSYVLSVSSLMRKKDFPAKTPHLDRILENAPETLANGGSCIAGPDGNWVLEPIVDKEGVFYAELALARVYEERQNFDPVGHYSRPDVTQLILNKERQNILKQ